MNHYILADVTGGECCGIYDRPNWEKAFFYPSEGKRLGAKYPGNVKFRMTAELPGKKLCDVIQNVFGMWMISARTKAVLELHARAEIEYLQFTLLDHTKRIASRECFIANVIGTLDCVDRQRTEGPEDPTEPGRLMEIDKLFLDDRRLDPERNLFRIETLPTVLVVREDLRAAMEAAGLSGLQFLDLGARVRLT